MKDVVLNKAIDITKHFLHSFYCNKDLEGIAFYLAQDAVLIGAGENEIYNGKQAIESYLSAGRYVIPLCTINNEFFNALDYGDCCMVYGSLTIKTTEKTKNRIEMNQKVSFLFSTQADKFWIKHIHISNSYAQMISENYFPSQIEIKNYRHLQQILREKTEVIEMIVANINGGLKISNDDEIYSNFYINEGLPKMLGYTYDEFMEKTNNCSVGAVYPIDLPKVLLSVTKQLENHMDFSVEYRMEKKDGTLIWVLESGRKSKDANGGYKLNSILIDITPLKTALFELEIERSRYRIALENITDVMFEYDVEEDLYITYQRIEIDGKTELERFEIPNFTKSLWTKNMVHPSDCEKFLDVIKGECRQLIEIRIKSIQATGLWRYAQVSCSAIYNNSRKTIRTIGTMKDVTDEKKDEDSLVNRTHQDKLTRLLNQMTARNYISKYLAHKDINSQSAFMILDIDDFKKINDTCGNLFANEVLIAVSNVLKESIRAEDIVGRIGGDTFIILLKRANRNAAELCAQRILERISKISKQKELEITVSMGIVMADGIGEKYDALLKMADRALYIAKENGKGQYIFYEEDLGLNHFTAL